MAITRLGGANAITGTLPAANINNTSIGNVTALPAAISTGKVLQVLGATDGIQRSTTSTSFVTGGNTLSVTITPSATSSKFAIFVNHYTYNANATGSYTIYRDSTDLGGSDGLAWFASNSGTVDGSRSYCFLDSPNTTSSITYQPYMKSVGAGTVYMCASILTAQIIVMEIAG